ncbi:Calcium-transporting ATPase 10, plasma membrane-type [Geranomyces variabilis]|nr:Calcium-transporting ATPase 10, plasma membrane-type [Geranomyces variabilis]
MSKRPAGHPNAVQTSQESINDVPEEFLTPTGTTPPESQQPRTQQGGAPSTQAVRHLPPLVHDKAPPGAAMSASQRNNGGGGGGGGGGGQHDGGEDDDEPEAVEARQRAQARLKNEQGRRDEAHMALVAKMEKLSPEEFGVTPEDLARVCNFDNRSSPHLLQILNGEFGGVEGLGVLLRVDTNTGLVRVSSPDAGNEADQPPADLGSGRQSRKLHKAKVGKQQVAPETDDGSHSPLPLPKKLNMTAVDKDARQAAFGSNLIPPPPSDTIIEMVWETIKEDPIIKVLIVGAIVVLSLGTAICPTDGYIEGLAILVAVVIVLSVTAGNDWSKDRKFKKLLLLQSDKRCKVVRGGVTDQISSWDVVVGDLVEVVVGDEIPADGIFVRGNRLVVDESPLTGESLPVKKSATSPYMFSGCQVGEGSGVMLVTGVGSRSSGGQIQELLNEAQNEETVLQAKLKQVAVLIGKIGVASGILTFLGLLIRWAISWAQHEVPATSSSCHGSGNTETLARIQAIAEDFVIGITVVVVAVPEGLPLAVTISLAFSMFKMIKDNCFVRHLDASETMGEATCICTDKTGTLTENRMTVVKALVGDQVYYGEGSGEESAVVSAFSDQTLKPHVKDILTEGIAVNSNCFVKMTDKGQPLFVGSATEGALLVFAEKLGVDYNTVRKAVKKVENGTWSFSSDRKRMSTLVEPAIETIPMAGQADTPRTRYRLYTKGASEIVLSLCTHIVDAQGEHTSAISAADISRIQRTIKRWASQGLRTLALAYRDTDQSLTTFEGNKKDDPEHDLVFVGLVGIKDPLRKEVPGAVATCQKAGLTIRMVTGDNILTACKIARECNIMFGDGIALEGPVFRSMSEAEKINVIPRLQVLARSSPADKHTLVNLLKRTGEVVAVTGDGTNDAPALKEADVGFAMGISGTQIAMNASDIVLLDDNFVSLVQSIRWGRNVLNCVRKFLQFQLGVNLVAIILTFVGSLTQGSSPLTTVQLLWVNLIMDSLGALALASDEPEDDILDHPPHARNESLLALPMRQYIAMQVVYQITILLCLFLGGVDNWIPYNTNWYEASQLVGTPTRRASTMVFLVFILMQLSNIVMARQLNGQLNFFKGFFRNKLFITIIFVIAGVQVLVVIFGGDFVRTCQIHWTEWLICIVLALLNFPFVFVCRAFCNLYRNNKHRPAGSRMSWSITAHDFPPAKMDPAVSPHSMIQIDRSNPDGVDSPMTPTNDTAPLTSSLHKNAPGASSGSMPGSAGGGHHTPHRPTGGRGTRWQTVRSAVVLMGALETVRSPTFSPQGPDPTFLENWIRFRKDVEVLPKKNGAPTRSSTSLRGGQ